MVHRLNQGTDLGGRNIGQVASFSIGVGVNPVHRDFDYEIGRFAWKVEAGAEWAITQPVFDIEAFFRFLDILERKNLTLPIVAGIWPLTSYRNAVFMNNEVPGVVIPPRFLERMAEQKTAEDGRKAGVELAQEMVEQLQKQVSGFQVSAPFGRIDMALAVLGLKAD
jgi:5,10-methylenetetrahydrofolate reductase